MTFVLKRIGLIVILWSICCINLYAQDLFLTSWAWIDEDDPPDTLPKFKEVNTPEVPEGLENYDSYAYALIEGGVLKSGKWWRLQFIKTHPKLDLKLFERPIVPTKPALRNRKKVNSGIWRALIYNPISAAQGLNNSTPRLVHVAPVVLPNEGKESRRKLVRTKVTVDKKGRIVHWETPPEWDKQTKRAAGLAFRKWQFEPARSNGIPVETTVEVPVMLRPDFYLETDFDTKSPPIPLKRVAPEYPLSQRIAGFEGTVIVDFLVDIEGRVKRAFVIKSNNPAFDEPAIEAVLQWVFKPAEVKGHPVISRMQVPIVFRLNERGTSAFEVQTRKKHQKRLPPEFRFDVAPRLQNISPAIYPYEALLAKKKGNVEFMFHVNTFGRARIVKIFKSPDKQFSDAVTAMVDTLVFEPALKKGRPTNALLAMKLRFGGPTGDISVSKSASSIIKKIRSNKKDSNIVSAKELDHRLIPVSQKPPIFPKNLNSEITDGKAIIEFYVDRNGLAQIPRFVSATEPAFGFSACQAVSTWRFRPPLKNGKPVAVKARVPVVFKR